MDKRVMLKPGQQASMGREGRLTVGTVDVNSVVAWKNGFFNFDHADVPAVMRQLSRWFGVEAVYTGAVPDRHFFGLIDRNLTLAQVLKVLEANGIHCTIDNKRLLIAP
jgi:hypothetical protein